MMKKIIYKMLKIVKKILSAILPEKKIVLQSNYVLQDRLLDNKRVLVIGGGTGIGLAIAKKLKAAGADVIVSSRNVHTENDDFVFVKWDVEDARLIETHFNDIVNKCGKIDIIVNSQGICPDDNFSKLVEKIDVDNFDKVMNINLKSVYFICQVACKYFKENNIKGHILNIASTEGFKGAVVPYGLSKVGVVSLTKGLGKREISNGIVINGIAPGATATSMMRRECEENLYANYIPSGRFSTPEEIANMALMLVSDMGNNMCGEVVVVDGGESLL